jgi:hypothetical protein
MFELEPADNSTMPTSLVDPALVRLASTVVLPAPALAVLITYQGAIEVEPAPWATAPIMFALEPAESETEVVGFATVNCPTSLVDPALVRFASTVVDPAPLAPG